MSRRTHVPGGRGAEDKHMSTPLRPRTTTSFFMQSVISFAVSLGVTITGIGYLHDSRWIRGFLALGLLYVVTSSFTLAKCVRDRQEETALVSRVDQAGLDKLLTEQDLLRVEDHGRPITARADMPATPVGRWRGARRKAGPFPATPRSEPRGLVSQH